MCPSVCLSVCLHVGVYMYMLAWTVSPKGFVQKSTLVVQQLSYYLITLDHNEVIIIIEDQQCNEISRSSSTQWPLSLSLMGLVLLRQPPSITNPVSSLYFPVVYVITYMSLFGIQDKMICVLLDKDTFLFIICLSWPCIALSCAHRVC